MPWNYIIIRDGCDVIPFFIFLAAEVIVRAWQWHNTFIDNDKRGPFSFSRVHPDGCHYSITVVPSK